MVVYLFGIPSNTNLAPREAGGKSNARAEKSLGAASRCRHAIGAWSLSVLTERQCVERLVGEVLMASSSVLEIADAGVATW